MSSDTKLSDIYHLLENAQTDYAQVGIIGGNLGALLFRLHYVEYANDVQGFDQVMQQVEFYLENIDVEQCRFSFCNGLAGFGWFIEYIVQRGWLETDTNEILAGLDEYLHQMMMNAIRNGNYDLLHGAIGVGYYLMQRLSKTPAAKKYIADLVDALDSQAQIEADGSMKWSAIDLLKGKGRANEFNLGLAHGIPSILSFLVKAYKLGIQEDQSLRMIKQTTNYLLKQQQDRSSYHACFPNLAGQTDHPSRLAWCYGDLGVSCALWQAANVLNDQSLRQRVINVMKHAATRRKPEDTRIVDGGLCHGTAGVAHIFRRFYDWTGEPVLQEAANHWYQQTLAMATFDDGLAGYKVYSPPDMGGWHTSVNLLEGISGIGLALLYQESGIDPAWEELLFIG